MTENSLVRRLCDSNEQCRVHEWSMVDARCPAKAAVSLHPPPVSWESGAAFSAMGAEPRPYRST